MAYVLLAVAITAEIIATTLLKYSQGLTKLIPSVICMVVYIICHVTFGRSIMKINLGIAYATWCGVGLLVTTLISVLLFKEKINVYGLTGIALIAIGCILVNLYGSGN